MINTFVCYDKHLRKGTGKDRIHTVVLYDTLEYSPHTGNAIIFFEG
jgi:hypothetical protein